MTDTYPQYYRKDGRIIRLDSQLDTWIIVLQPQSKVAMRYHTKWPDAKRLQEQIAGMEQSTAEKFREFLATFYQQVAAEGDTFSKSI